MTETKAKHTPETWRADICKDRIMAYVYGPKHPDGSEYAPLFETTNHAHARLVAAAPDLLEAAKAAKELLEELHVLSGDSFDLQSPEIYCALEAAITRAKGDAK